mmetsp:Transcript_7880/g.19585  ORF Transcript_7880/g.19585 Transcript_7880/m.19585 type:complete len:149 (+) Transcript_7880:2471-2917(+)
MVQQQIEQRQRIRKTRRPFRNRRSANKKRWERSRVASAPEKSESSRSRIRPDRERSRVAFAWASAASENCCSRRKIVQFETENVPKFSPRNSDPLKTRNQERSRVASELVSTAKIIAFAEQITINKPKKYKWELTTGWNCHPVILINR